jgi:xanthine dehydrogenase accessory factor
MTDLWTEILQCLERGEPVVVATVVGHSGSTPRTSGSKMLVYSDGRISGTVGGGALEGDVIRQAINLFATRSSAIRFYDLNETTATYDLDLVCGGKMHVFLEYVPAEQAVIDVYRALADSVASSKPVFLATLLHGDDDHLQVTCSVITPDGRPVDPALEGIPESDELHDALASAGANTTARLVPLGTDRLVIEPVAPPDTVYLLGAGHVSLELAWLIHRLAFRTVVIDDRPEFATKDRFAMADNLRVCPDFEDVFDGFTLDERSLVVIVTRGHRFDKKTLAQALATEAGYVGMIGSARKRDTIYKGLADDGVDPAQLERVHCPVGLDIEAETPAEIAVSIAAQLIEHRARRLSHG